MRRLAGAGALMYLLLGPLASADLPTTETLQQRRGVELKTHIGGAIFSIKKTAPLPNAFGKRDIFGRKVDKGYKELRYLGQSKDGFIRLRITEVDTTSNETTMSRSGLTFVTGGATHTYNPALNSAYSQGNATVIRSPQGRTELLPPNTTEFEIDSAAVPEIDFGSVRVEFLKAEPAALNYRLK